MSAFQGVINVPLKTLTAAYTPSEGNWSFARTPTPIQYSSYSDTVKGIYTGLYGGIFDLTNLFTTFAYGQKGPFRDDGYTTPAYVQGRIRGFIANPGIDDFANWYDLPITLGSNQVYPLISRRDGQGSDGTPASSCIVSQLGANNIIYSSQQVFPTLTTKYAYSLAPSLASGRMLFQFPDQALFNTNFSVLNPDPSNRDWCLIGGTVANPPNLALVDFQGLSVRYFDVTWDNADINTELTFNQDFSRISMPTPFGWLYTTVTGTAVVEGKAYNNGYMVLTSHDGTRWWFINIIPTDFNAGNWNHPFGSGSGCFLQSGEMVYHHNNYDNVVLVSTSLANLFKVLPVFPPVNLPKPPADTEGQILPYREQNANS